MQCVCKNEEKKKEKMQKKKKNQIPMQNGALKTDEKPAGSFLLASWACTPPTRRRPKEFMHLL
jgi:hypothetical protein